MKIQCNCGTKYEFAVTPEMAKSPIRFVCAKCGLDASQYVAQLVYQELGIAAPAAPVPVAAMLSATPGVGSFAPMPTATATVISSATAAPAYAASAPPPVAVAPPPSAPRPSVRMTGASVSTAAPAPVASIGGTPASVAAAPPSGAMAGLKIHKEGATVHGGTAMPSAPTPRDDAVRCSRHPGQFAREKCLVCGKPLCPQCMALFGYVCSPLCRGKAEDQGIKVPRYAGQKSAIEEKVWRKTVLTFGSVVGVLGLLIGSWALYAWYLSRPSTKFAVRFEDKVYSGSSAFAGKDQIIFLRGGTLARYDMKAKKEVWSHYLIDKSGFAKEIDEIEKSTRKAIDDANNNGREHVPKMPDREKLAKSMERSAAEAMQLRVAGQNIWVMTREYGSDDDSSWYETGYKAKLIRYDWDTGNLAKELPVNSRFGSVLRKGDELLLVDDKRGRRTITHIDLNTTDIRTEVLSTNDTQLASAKGIVPGTVGKAKSGGGKSQGLPNAPGQDNGKALDPAKVKEQASKLSYPAKLALPATLANAKTQNAALQEMDNPDGKLSPEEKEDKREHVNLMPTDKGFLQVNVQLLEKKLTARSAMKAAPNKPALDGNVSAGRSLEVAQDMLNEMQRERGGDVVYEDESRYRIKVQHPDTTEAWSEDVVGRPEVFPLKTVTVVSPNKQVIVLDKSNKKLWQANLTYSVEGRFHEADEEETHYGEGPCVEKNNNLYVFDQGMLTAFDKASGNVHWRVPSVGISGLFFDGEGNLYVNTSDASPDSIKYSRQIDLSTRVSAVVMKVDAKTGKTVWTSHPGGDISYISGKYIYSVQSQDVDDEEDGGGDNTIAVLSGNTGEAYVRIRRIDPKTGKVLWEHFEQRCPLQLEFDKNIIRMVFKKEVKVMKYFTF